MQNIDFKELIEVLIFSILLLQGIHILGPWSYTYKVLSLVLKLV